MFAAQATSNRFLDLRLIILGMCFIAMLSMVEQSHAESVPEASTPKHYMLWPLLPGETIQSLATQLYPQSTILQQRFIQQTIALSRHHAHVIDDALRLTADMTFKQPQLIAVPREQALTDLTHRIKKVEELLVTQYQATNIDKHQPFGDYRYSFKLSTNQALTEQSKNKPSDEEAPMPKIVFEAPAETKQADSQSTNASQIEPADIAAPAPMPITTAHKHTPTTNQTIAAQSRPKPKANINPYWQTAIANLKANFYAFKQGNINDWLHHPQLKWLCLEGLVLVLLLLYGALKNSGHIKK